MTAHDVSTVPPGREIQGRIVIVGAGLTGLLYSSIELGRRLAAAGHRVIYAGPRGVREPVESHDLTFFAVEPGRYPEFLEEDSRAGTLRRLARLRQRRREAIRSLELEPFVEAVRSQEPDLVLIDGEMHEQIFALTSRGIPVALLNTFPSIWRRAGVPPPHVMARPGVGWRGSRLAIAAFWYALRLRKWRRMIGHRLRHVGCDRISILRQMAQRDGLDVDALTDDSQWLIPFTYRRLPYLSLHALEFEFPHRPPAHVRYVGPMVLESRTAPAQEESERDDLEAILARRRSAAQPTRLIYAGFGSVFSTDLDFARRLSAVVNERPGWELILSSSGRIAPADLDPLPERTHVFSWVSQMRILQHADAVVTHGGLNTLDECVLSGVPVLVYCGGETDMAGNTARVVHHGIGLAGDRPRDSTEQIRHHLDRLLSEPGFADNVARLRRRYEAYRQNRVAENVVQSLLQRDPRLATARAPAGDRR
jgi:UDP:flavonoid glycosyltransferase YjiC (YdhE family)